MVSIRSALRGLYSAAAIAGATAGGGPPAGRAMAAFLQSAPGKFIMDKAIDNTLKDQDLDSGNFATGGLVMNPTLALIGEAGPELVLPLVPTKVKRKTTKYQKELGRQLAKQNKLHRLKNGSLRKGKTSGMLLSTAHKLTKRALGTKKGQVRKTARRAFRR